MSTDIDWQRELDSSFGSGADAPPAHYVAIGRGAVRRRRAAALVLAASIAVGGTAAWAASPGSAPRGDAPVATQGPSLTDRATTTPDKKTREEQLRSLKKLREDLNAQVDFLGGPAALTDRGLVLAPQAGPVVQRVRNPMGYTAAQGSSIAVRVMFQGSEHYSLMSLFDDGSSTFTNEASGDFAGWVAQSVRSQRTLDTANGVTPSSGDTSDGPWLTLTPRGEITSTRPGIVLVEVRTDVDLGTDFAASTDRTGAVRLLVDGRSEFAAYRIADARLEVIPGGGTFDSLDAFLSWAREQYASGQGMR